MEQLIHGVRDAVEKRSWYAAVALALALPDACAALDQPGVRGAQRYRSWADRYVIRYFCDANGRPYLNSRELYLFRCAYLHAGEFELDEPAPIHGDAATAMFEVLNRVHLYVSEAGLVAARGMTSTPGERSTSYSIGVSEFCEAICKGADEWLESARRDPLMCERLAAHLRIIELRVDGSHRVL